MTTNPNDLPGCAKHPERPGASTCDECQAPLCTQCTVEVPHLGTFCRDCGSWRGGLRPRPPRVYEPLSMEPRQDAIARFEVDAFGTEPRPLISGLAERLSAAGIEPRTVALEDDEDDEDDEDEGTLFDDMDRLRDTRVVVATPHHWWQRGA